MTPQSLPYRVTWHRRKGFSWEVAEAGPEEGPLVILLHGFPDLWPGWHFQIPPLVEAGYRVLVPNQRGYGESDKPRAIADYDLDILADDIADLADGQCRETFHLVGHDWGGIVACWTAVLYPHRVKRLAMLSAPHPAAFRKYVFSHPTQMVKSTYAALFQLPWLPEATLSAGNYAGMWKAVQNTAAPGTFDESDRRYLMKGWTRDGSLSAMLNYYRAYARRKTSTLDRRVTVPTRILFGTRDPAEEVGLAHATAAYCDDAQVVELPGARHWIQREEAQRVNAELMGFLGEGGATRPV